MPRVYCKQTEKPYSHGEVTDVLSVIAMSSALDSLVPITRFNRGEARKIFDEVQTTGCKIVLNNNKPACVLLTPEKYQEMVDMIEDQYLIALAMERMSNDTGAAYSFEEILEKDGMTREELDKIPMEYGVDFG
jgi:PHD/YefM family antitoxin component YafN of YafNO toxin-antitoxin module